MFYEITGRKALEYVASMIGTVLGAWIWGLSIFGLNALHWSDTSIEMAKLIGLMMMVFGVIHWAGVKINGRWAWSPLLRMIGSAGHGFVLWSAVLAGFRAYPYSTAIPLYTIISLALIWFAFDAFGQLIFNIKTRGSSTMSTWRQEHNDRTGNIHSGD